jgi:GntR family transcriptional repressor for pyruvate dehydrogenase complex
MTNAKPKKRSAVWEAADALRRDIIDKADGEPLGSEDDLIAHYGVSRPTLRQAATIVSQENLLRVKRGVGGGYFACRPNSKAVAHVAAIYLRSRNTELREISDAIAPIRVELAKLAAGSTNVEARERLRVFVERETEQGPDQRYKDFLKAERVFGTLLGELSANKMISLFLDILYDFSAMLSLDEDVYISHPERVREYRKRRNAIAKAVLEGDEELAILTARRCGIVSAEWMRSDNNGVQTGELLGLLGPAPSENGGGGPHSRPL